MSVRNIVEATVETLPWRRLRLDTVSIHRIFPELVGLTWTTVGIAWSAETPFLCGALKAVGAEVALEVGTFNGSTTLQLAANLPPQGKVYTVDIPPDQEGEFDDTVSRSDRRLIAKGEASRIGSKYRGTPYEPKIVQLLGDSATLDYTPYFSALDFLYIDGGHSYEQVRADTERLLPLVRKGGVAFWHDYKPGCVGVLRDLHELALTVPVRHVAGTELVVLRVE